MKYSIILVCILSTLFCNAQFKVLKEKTLNISKIQDIPKFSSNETGLLKISSVSSKNNRIHFLEHLNYELETIKIDTISYTLPPTLKDDFRDQYVLDDYIIFYHYDSKANSLMPTNSVIAVYNKATKHLSKTEFKAAHFALSLSVDVVKQTCCFISVNSFSNTDLTLYEIDLNSNKLTSFPIENKSYNSYLVIDIEDNKGYEIGIINNKEGEVSIKILSANGKIVNEFHLNLNQAGLNLSGLSIIKTKAGQYVCYGEFKNAGTCGVYFGDLQTPAKIKRLDYNEIQNFATTLTKETHTINDNNSSHYCQGRYMMNHSIMNENVYILGVNRTEFLPQSGMKPVFDHRGFALKLTDSLTAEWSYAFNLMNQNSKGKYDPRLATSSNSEFISNNHVFVNCWYGEKDFYTLILDTAGKKEHESVATSPYNVEFKLLKRDLILTNYWYDRYLLRILRVEDKNGNNVVIQKLSY